MQSIPKVLFQEQAKIERKWLELVEHFEMPVWETWAVDWKELKKINLLRNKDRWQELSIYQRLAEKKSKPAVYCLTTKGEQRKNL